MPKNINSAYRVHLILTKAASQDAGIATVEAWARTFSIADGNGPNRNIAIVRMVGLLHDEIERARDKMKATNFSTELYRTAFQNASLALSVEALNQPWQNCKIRLDPTTLKALAFCSELLPNEELLISEKDLVGLEKEIMELKARLSVSNLPDEVKSFIFEQLRIIENALREYPISGSKVFTEALIKATAGAAQDPDVAKRSSETDEFQTLKKIWNFIKEANSNVDTVQKLLAAGTAAATIAGTIAGSH